MKTLRVSAPPSLLIAYLRDAGVVLGIRHRDSKGRFTRKNPYRFQATNIAVCGASRRFLAQCPMYGSYLKAIKQ